MAFALRERGHEPLRVAHFINRLVFCMFAEDVNLLPNEMFSRMLAASLHRSDQFPLKRRRQAIGLPLVSKVYFLEPSH